MAFAAPLKTGIQMPLPMAVGGYRERNLSCTLPIRNRPRTIAGKSSPLGARLMKLLGLRKIRRARSPKVVAAIKRAQAITAITPQEYLF
jgi:hypothetical protein